MQPRDSSALLPAEIILQIFGNLDLADFRLLMAVSRRWRDLVFCHPLFWTTPRLDNTSAGAVAFFIRRIMAGAGKPTSISVVLPEPTTLLVETVLPTMATVLDSAVSLTLHVHISHTSAVFDLLRGPTSFLRTLDLAFSSHDQSSPVWLPGDILSQRCHPDGLESVLLKNIDIPHALPASLSTAKNLIYDQQFTAALTDLQTLAGAFPHLCDLTLTGRVLRPNFSSSDWPKPWEYLPSLVIAMGKRSLRKALSMIPLANVVHLTTVFTGRRALALILPHLQGELHMSFQSITDDDFAIHLASWQTGITRSFREHQRAWAAADSLPHNLLHVPMAAECVATMTIPVALWDLLVPLMVPFPRLKVLTLVLSLAGGHALLLADSNDPKSALFCPRLQFLTLHARDGVPVIPLADVERIILERLRVSGPIDLVMSSVDWHGSPASSSMINTVSKGYDSQGLYPDTPWHNHYSPECID